MAEILGITLLAIVPITTVALLLYLLFGLIAYPKEPVHISTWSLFADLDPIDRVAAWLRRKPCELIEYRLEEGGETYVSASQDLHWFIIKEGLKIHSYRTLLWTGDLERLKADSRLFAEVFMDRVKNWAKGV